MGLFREILQKEATVTTHLQTKHSVEDEQFNKMLKYHATRQRLERTPGGGLPYLQLTPREWRAIKVKQC